MGSILSRACSYIHSVHPMRTLMHMRNIFQEKSTGNAPLSSCEKKALENINRSIRRYQHAAMIDSIRKQRKAATLAVQDFTPNTSMGKSKTKYAPIRFLERQKMIP